MVPVARRNLMAEKTSFVVAVGGVAFAVFLIIIIMGIYLEFRRTFTALIDDVPAEVWVVQDGAFDMFHSDSTLPEGVAQSVAQVPGVRSVQKLVGGQTSFRTEEGGSVRAYVVAFGGGAGAMAEGNVMGLQGMPGPGEMIISDLLTRQSGVGVGDRLRAGEHEFVVVGTTSEDLGFRGFSFLNFQDAQSLFAQEGMVNYLAVSLRDPSQAQAVAQTIEARLPSVAAFTREEFADSSRKEMSSFEPILAVLMVLAFVVGATVISLTIYTTTVEKAQEFGVMKALGASATQLYRIVLSQSFVLGLVGFAIGVPMAFGVSNLIERFVPEFVALFEWQAIAAVLVAVLAMSLVAAYLPVRRIARIEPAVVFRA